MFFEHVQHRHPALLTDFDKACEDLTNSNERKRKADTADDQITLVPQLKQPRLDAPLPLTQSVLDGYVLVCMMYCFCVHSCVAAEAG